MATPAARLSVELDANTTRATAQLTKYDKQLAAVNVQAKKGIETRLGAQVDQRAFAQYEAQLARTAARAKQRDAFKAELGANFNNAAFNAYQRELQKAERETKRTQQTVDRTTPSIATLGSGLRGLVSEAAKITAVGIGAQAISALGAAATATVASLGPLAGAFAAMPALASAGAQGLGTWKLAFSGVTTAVGGLNERLDQNSKAFRELTPEGKKFAQELERMKQPLRDLSQTAQKGMLPGLEAGIKSAMGNFGILKKGVGDTAKVLGEFGRQAGAMIGSKAFGQDLQTQIQRNNVTLQRFGSAALNVADAFRHIIISAGPLVDWITRTTVRLSQQIDAWAKAGRESGKFAAFFDQTKAVMTDVGKISANLAVALVNIFKGAYPTGKSMLDLLVQVTRHFRDWTGSFAGQNRIRQFFEESKPAMIEAGRLLVALAQAFGRLGAGNQVAGLLRALRVDLLPAIEKLVSSTTNAFGPAFIDAAKQMVLIFTQLGGSSGPLVAIVRLFGTIAKGVNWLLDNIPGLAPVLAGAFVLSRVAAFATAIEGIGKKYLITAGIMSRPLAVPGLVPTTAAGRTAAAETGAAAAGAAGAGAAGAGAGLAAASKSLLMKALGVGGIVLLAAPLIKPALAQLFKFAGDIGGASPEAKTAGQKLAANLAQGFGTSDFRAQLANQLDQSMNAMVVAGPKAAQRLTTAITAQGPAAQQAGRMIAQQLEAGWAQYRFQNAPIMLQQLISQVRNMPPQVRAEAIKSALAFAQGLQQSGQLPKGAVQFMLSQINALFPGWRQYVQLQGVTTAQGFANAMKLQQAQANVQAAMNSMRSHFPEVVAAMEQTKGGILPKAKAVEQALQQIATHGSGPMRQQARTDLAQLHQAINGYEKDAANIRGWNSAVKGTVDGLKNAQLGLNNALKGMPSSKSATVKVNVDFLSNVGGFIQSIGGQISGAITQAVAPGSGIGHRYTGGLVTRPGYFAGEEAPRHPEVIIATNPAYRQANLGYWARAGAMLGVPGFASGGLVPGDATAVRSAPPWAQNKATGWARGKATDWAKAQVQKIAAATAAAGGAGTLPPGASQAQVAAAMMAAAGQIIGRPYLWGGGHGGFSSPGYDCSGAVSYVLHAGGLLSSPMTTDGLKNWGLPGGGKYITVGVRGTSGANAHTMLSFFGHFLESGGGGPQGASNVHWDSGWDGVFPISRHPPGFARGGVAGDFGEQPPALLLQGNPRLAQSGKFAEYMRKFGKKIPGFAKGGWVRTGATIDPTMGQAPTYSAHGGFSFAELLEAGRNAGMRPDLTQLLGLPRAGRTGMKMGTPILVRMPSAKTAFTIWKNDVGSGQAGNKHYTIDLHQAIANALGWAANQDVEVAPIGASAGVGGTVGTTVAENKAAVTGTGNYPTGAVFGPSQYATKKGRDQLLNIGGRSATVQHILNWSKTWQAKLMGMPAPPRLSGFTPDTISGAGRVQAQINQNKAAIDGLSSKADTLTSFYGWDQIPLLDKDGNRDEAAIKKAVSELDIVLKIRQEIFRRWQLVVALTQRLVAANRLIIARLNKGLASIKTKGLKGQKLNAAKEQIKNTKELIKTFQGNLGTASNSYIDYQNQRDQAWLGLDTLTKSRATIKNTPAQPTSAGTGPGATDTTAPAPSETDITAALQQQLQLTQTLLTQARQTTAVSQAQFGVLKGFPFVGAFQAGGITPATGWALVGERGPELARLPGGSRVLNADQTAGLAGGQPVVVVQVLDGAVDQSKIRVIAGAAAQAEMRRVGRSAGRSLPSGGGGR